MNNEEADQSDDAIEKAKEIVEAVSDETKTEEADDGLTEPERIVEQKKESERIKKARELKKQLRKRELGLIHYRWPAAVLILGALMAILTEFLVVMEHEAGIGFDTFFEEAMRQIVQGAIGPFIFFIFPIISGTLMIFVGILAYNNPRASYLSIIPAAMMAMAGMNVYFWISFGRMANPDAELAATGTPLTMLVVAVLCLLAIGMKEKE